MSEEYKIGFVTDTGDEIAHIYGSNGETIVFENTSGKIRWRARCHQDIFSKSITKYKTLGGRVSSALPEQLNKSIESELAISLYNALVSDSPDNVDDYFEHIEKRISSTLSPNQAKLWLILFSLISSFLIIVFLYFIFTKIEQGLSSMILCSGAGVMGSLMSLMQRNTTVAISLEDGKPYIFMQATFIPLLGLFSGVSLYFLSYSDLAFSFAKENLFNLLVLSVVAGFSERFVPDLFHSASENLTSKGTGR